MLAKLKNIIFNENNKIQKLKKYLRNNGANIGDNVRIFDFNNTVIDIQNPHMLEIGNNVYITSGTKILTHDYSWVVLSGVYGEILGGVGKVKIGNNVFIGVNSVILKNTEIGDNVIIGAGSIVSGKIESNSVYAGNPAKKIMTLEEYYQKKKKNILDNGLEIYNNYYKSNKKIPTREIFYEYISLFVNSKKELTDKEKALIVRTRTF